MTTGGSRYRWFILVLAALVLGTAAPAAAQSAGAEPDDDGPVVVVTGRVTVPEGQKTDAVIILDGDADVAGRVDGPVLSLIHI